MADKTDTGKSVAKLLAVVSALISGEMLRTTDRPEGVEVVAVMRDNWPGSPVVVRMVTATGTETVWLDDVEIAES